MSEEKTNVTAPRVERIEGILKSDPVLKDKLTEKTTVKTRDGRVQSVYKASVEVVTAIHAAGHDAYTVSKNDVLKIARNVLSVKAESEPPVASSVAAAPAKPAEASIPPSDISGRKHLICAVNLLLGAMAVAEKHDTGDGHEKRLKELNGVMDSYTKAYQGSR